FFFFFFQAEDGIRDSSVTGVQTCALPILIGDIAPSPIIAMTLFFSPLRSRATAMPRPAEIEVDECAAPNGSYSLSARLVKPDSRSEERRVGEEGGRGGCGDGERREDRHAR